MAHSNARAFSPAARLRSFVYAGRGIGRMVASQHNAWIHAAATFAVVAAGWLLGVTRLEWALLVFAIALVWVTEGINTAFELLCNVASPEYHPQVAAAKDVAAGAVLISALAATVIGLLVLGPYLVAHVLGR